MNEANRSKTRPSPGAICPYCGSGPVSPRVEYVSEDTVEIGRCGKCGRLLVHVNRKLLYPDEPVGIEHFANLPRELQRGLAEACSAAQASPNASCSLLLPYLEKMCDSLGAEGANLGEKVADLKAKGKIPEEFGGLFHAPIPQTDTEKIDAARQQALDLGSLAAYLGPHLPFMD